MAASHLTILSLNTDGHAWLVHRMTKLQNSLKFDECLAQTELRNPLSSLKSEALILLQAIFYLNLLLYFVLLRSIIMDSSYKVVYSTPPKSQVCELNPI